MLLFPINTAQGNIGENDGGRWIILNKFEKILRFYFSSTVCSLFKGLKCVAYPPPDIIWQCYSITWSAKMTQRVRTKVSKMKIRKQCFRENVQCSNRKDSIFIKEQEASELLSQFYAKSIFNVIWLTVHTKIYPKEQLMRKYCVMRHLNW